MKFQIVNGQDRTEDAPVKLALRMNADDIPTVYANDIPVIEFRSNGKIYRRCTDLDKLGFHLTSVGEVAVC